MNWITILALCMIFIGGVGAIILTVGQAISSAKDKKDITDFTENENLKLNLQLTDLQKERDILKLDLEIRDKRIHEQTQKIVRLNEQLVEKSDYFSNHLIGGRGFPVIAPSVIKAIEPTKNEEVTFTLHNDNALPLYDITAVVMDWNYILSKQTKSDDPNNPYLKQEDLAKAIIHSFNEPQMFENSRIITREKFDLSDALLHIELKSRSSFVYEKLAFVIENNVVYYGFLIHDSKGKILKEWITPGTTPSAEVAIKKKFDLIPNKVIFTLTE